MLTLPTELEKLLACSKLIVFPEDYVIIYLPIDISPIPGEWFCPATTRFAAIIQEPKLITMVVPRQKWLRMQNMFKKFDLTGPCKIISFDTSRSLFNNGFLATIVSVLSKEKISAFPISSFKHDKIIVPKAELPHAVKVLSRLQRYEAGLSDETTVSQ